MKKLVAWLLVLAMAVTMVACSAKKDGDKNEKTPISDNMETVINKILEEYPTQFMGATQIPLDLTDTSEEGLLALQAYTGLENGDKLEEAVAYESMVGSIAFSMVLARVKDSGDTETIAKEMNEKINTAKWICVEANDKKVAGYDDVILFVMLNTDLELEAQGFVDAFQKVCGHELDFVI